MPAASTAARTRPEVLAPAGDFECVRAAVENGADAVYFGLSKHNARARATNFTIEELPDVLGYLRLRGVRGYVAFNTLIFTNELVDAAAYLEKIIAAAPDALIVQDLGVARLAREISPDVHLHASTQTTTTSAEQMKHLQELGFERVILARELTLAEIEKIRAATDMPLEVFVHGALCVAYSGQCLTSEALGGRSANRGACAQACRLPYDLIVDGKLHDLGEQKYLISPQDLMAFDLVPKLADLGVVSLKIEGRLKTPEYVAATTRAYRGAVDGMKTLGRNDRLDLQQVFSRGFTRGWLGGINHQTLVAGLSPKKRGVLLGVVDALEPRVRLKLKAPVKPGDGVVFDAGHPESNEEGGRVYEIRRDGRRVDVADSPQTVELAGDFKSVRVGDRVWKTDDPATRARLRATFETEHRRVPVDATVEGAVGAPLQLTITDGTHRVSAESETPLTEARSRPFTVAYLREHVGRLGATPFLLRDLDASIEGFLPVRELNDLRRRAATDLERLRRAAPAWTIRSSALQRLRTPVASTSVDPQLVVMCHSLEQVDAALAEGVRKIECDFENPKLYHDAVAKVRAAGAWIALAPPRIFKPGEGAIVKRAVECAPDALLVRSLAHLDVDIEKVGDFSLNVANDLTARWLLGKGLTRLVPSYDLSFDQLAALLAEIPAAAFEVVVHQHMPMFHMEHCVIAMALSDGTDATNCGRPCDRHKLDLRDRRGFSHPLAADIGCRNTIYNAVAQSASPYVRRLLDLGVRWFRVELLRESPDDARRLIRAYRDLLDGRADGQALWQDLKASSFFGITRGPLGGADG